MKRYILPAVGLVLVGFGVWAYIWWHSPSETKQFTAKNTAERVLGSEVTLIDWDAQYFTTRYPSDLRIVTSNEVPHGLTTGQYLLGSTVMNRTDQLAVTVGKLDGLSFEELPAIKLRRLKSDVYQPSSIAFAPEGSMAFTANNEFETSVFWAQGERYAAVVVSGSVVRATELRQQLEAVLTNWQWK